MSSFIHPNRCMITRGENLPWMANEIRMILQALATALFRISGRSKTREAKDDTMV